MAVDPRTDDDDEVSVSPLHPERPRTAFVLGGGGNLGAIQVGMLRALVERDVVPDQLVGCSVGAINAAGLAANPTMEGVKELEEIWLGMSGDDLMPASRLSGLWLLTRKYRSLQPNDGMRRLIAKLPFKRFEEALVPLHVVATALRDGSERWFSSGSVAEPILASAALPAVFPPVEVEGELFIDGAVVNNVPISKALELNAERIYVLHVGNFHRPRPVPKRPIDALLQSFSIARNYRFLAETSAPPPEVEMVVLPGLDPGSLRPNDFSHSRQLIERAYVMTGSFLDAHSREASGA